MTLNEKRKVIEVLLIVSTSWQPLPRGVSDALGYGELVAKRAWRLLHAEWHDLSVLEAATAAAYRLIESSPTLRAEWFGAR